jgi:ring-1,2-phenylacetyl-CoA epoxidase subunit PaaD
MPATMAFSEKDIMEMLEQVKDPEIPVISLIDLGVITAIAIEDSEKVRVEMTPTFAGCPAMDYMKKDVERVLKENGVKNFAVNVSFDSQWSSNNISDKGKEALRKFGLAPPPKIKVTVDLDILKNTPCPFCNSTDTELKSPFGPTLCRALHYCNNCHQAFEQFKPV